MTAIARTVPRRRPFPRERSTVACTASWADRRQPSLDVARPVVRGVRVEVERPPGRALAPREPLRRIRRERLQHVALDPAMPRHQLRGSPGAPPAVDQAVDRVHVEAAHLREPPLAPEHAGAVLLPVHDVGERVFHGPRISRRRAGHAPLPVGGAQPRDETIEDRVLATGARDDFLLRVAHGYSPPAPSLANGDWTCQKGASSVVTTSSTIGSLAPIDAVELADELRDRFDADADTAHGLGDPRVVVAPELRGDEPIAAPALSVLHPAEHAVVEHDGHDRDLVLRGGEERVHRHREAAVAADGHTVALRARELGAHRGRQRVAHAADRRRLIHRAGPFALEVVGHVEAIGAGVHRDDRAVVEAAGELGDHALGTQRHRVRALLGLGEVPMQRLELGQMLQALLPRGL